MTQAELLNYILEKEKIKKEDFAKLFGIRKKNIEKALNGETALTKRQIKNISDFTGIPQEAIKSGEINLPDLQSTGVVFINEEFVKNQNTERFQKYIKNRFKISFSFLFLLKLFIYFILIFLSIFTGCAFFSAFIENIDKSTAFSAFFALIPYLLGFASIVPMFKVVKKANVNEIKRVKLYYYFIIIANIISLISLVALNANHWGFFALGLFFISIPLVFLILENNNRANKKQIKILSTILMLVVLVGYELVQSYPATDRECYYTLIFIGLNLTLLTAHIFYWAIKDLTEFSNNFQMLNNKKCFKNRKVLRSLISVLLVTIIVAGGFHFGKLVTLKLSVDRALNSETFKYEFIQYSKYDKSNVNFTEEDETIIVNRGTFTYKIPQGMKDTTQEGGIYITHKNEAETILVASSYQPIKESYTSIFDYYEYELFSNETGEDVFDSSKPIFHSKMSKIMKDMLVEEYGFYPQNDYESRKIGGMLNLEDINYLDKQEAHAAAILAVFYAISSPAYDEAYFFETDELEGVVGIMEHTNEETGEKSCSYIFNFNKPNSEWLDCCVMVRLPEDVASTDLAYKIINSIEITEA